jgi:TorA maturation chaperone TorD
MNPEMDNGIEKEVQTKQRYRSFFLEHLELWVNRFFEVTEKEAETFFFNGLLKITKEMFLEKHRWIA